LLREKNNRRNSNEKIELNDNNLETLMKWSTPRKNYEKWTEDDELLYRKLFDEPYMYLPEEIDDEDEGEYKRGTRRYCLYSMGYCSEK
jgi:hypothetical protein